jgi:hypothetical protein
MLINKNKLLISRNFDVFVFGILFAFVLLPQLQFIANWIVKFKIREVLYILLYFRIITFYKIHLTKNLIAVFIFLIYSIFIGFHTFFLYGSDLAYYGFIRFVNVALLAPLAATILQDLKQVKYFINIWLIVIVIAAFSALYQFFGEDISFLQFPYYMASRGGLIRYRTILGEPNIGGMASVIVYIYSILFVSIWPLKFVFLLASIILLFLSLSKAALGGYILATFLLIFCNSKFLFNSKKKINSQVVLILSYVLIIIIVFIVMANIEIDFKKYATTSFLSFFNRAENPGAYKDIINRLITLPYNGVKLALRESGFYVLNFLAGSSFSIAGSAAKTIRGELVILPHNSFLEIYLVGGMIMISIFITILILTYKKLKLKSKNVFYQPILLSFIIIILLMFTYPIIYEPVMGSFFWLIVGISCNYRLNRMI